MFEALTQKLQSIFQRLARKGYLTEADVDSALKEVRLALLEADVHYQVVKDFLARVRERAVGAEVMKSLTPAQQVIKIVYEELVKVLGEGGKLSLTGQPPHVIMLVGLQGCGKTTTAAKLALKLKKEGHFPLLVAADTRRPAAIAQLEVLGRQLDIPVYKEEASIPSPQICVNALKKARADLHTVVILDTAGRLHINEELMRELEEIKKATSPAEVILVADAMTGQDAVKVAQEFHHRVGLTGLILTKMDGDARGGAAISIRAVTGVPIKFIGVGEKLHALEEFHPDRLASRILGMGDVLTLIEKAQEVIDQEKALKATEKLLQGEFTLEDFLTQIKELKKLGPLSQLLELIPGFSSLTRELPLELTDRQLKRVEAIINSMTPEERRRPEIINASRKRRIARGSGTTVQEVNELLVQFRQVQRMMKEMKKGRLPGLLRFLS
ncbi:MAG: signal recognition particle protein [Anaerolineae bacterium]|nr:signal recognition particle protein [Anaerolineae bacterium]MDW8103060.1 signal recognition particle protein [Anaerolineae bacterium]